MTRATASRRARVNAARCWALMNRISLASESVGTLEVDLTFDRMVDSEGNEVADDAG